MAPWTSPAPGPALHPRPPVSAAELGLLLVGRRARGPAGAQWGGRARCQLSPSCLAPSCHILSASPANVRPNLWAFALTEQHRTTAQTARLRCMCMAAWLRTQPHRVARTGWATEADGGSVTRSVTVSPFERPTDVRLASPSSCRVGEMQSGERMYVAVPWMHGAVVCAVIDLRIARLVQHMAHLEQLWREPSQQLLRLRLHASLVFQDFLQLLAGKRRV